METIKKSKNRRFNQTAFLLGERKDGEKVYLQAGSWDCDWYWGFGYIEVYGKRDINEHYHFDSLFNKFGLEGIEEHFKSFVLNESEMWVLADLMKSFYSLKETAEFYHQGNSHYTNTGVDRKDLKMYKKINADIEGIIKQVEKLLS